MLQPALHTVIENIEAIDTSQVYLLVQSGNGFFGFASFFPEEKKINGWVVYQYNKNETTEDLQTKVSEVSAKHTWVHSNYKKIVIVQYGSNNVLVPAELNSGMAKHRLLEMNNGFLHESDLQKDVVLQQSLVNHYAVPKSISSILNQRFHKGEWWHVQSLLLTKRAGAEAKMRATIRFNDLQLSVEKDGEWLLIQTYQFQTPEDVLYFILNAMQQLQLSQDETTVILQGWIDQHSVLYDTLYSYILNLKLNDTLTYQFPSATDHPFYLSASLDQVLSCVS